MTPRIKKGTVVHTDRGTGTKFTYAGASRGYKIWTHRLKANGFGDVCVEAHPVEARPPTSMYNVHIAAPHPHPPGMLDAVRAFMGRKARGFEEITPAREGSTQMILAKGEALKRARLQATAPSRTSTRLRMPRRRSPFG